MKAGTLSLFAALLLGGCGDDWPPAVDVTGAWSYDWQVREDGGTYPGWDGHFHGAMVLEQDGVDVTGTLGYPDEDPETLFGLPGARDAWRWSLAGAFVGDELHLFAPAPNTLWDDGWKWHLTVTGGAMVGPSWAGPAVVEKWPFRATH